VLQEAITKDKWTESQNEREDVDEGVEYSEAIINIEHH
jgi:hypothetical protein